MESENTLLFIVLIVSFVAMLISGKWALDSLAKETQKAVDNYEKQELKNTFSEIEINKVLDKYEPQRKKAIEDYMNGFISGIDPYDKDGEGSKGTL